MGIPWLLDISTIDGGEIVAVSTQALIKDYTGTTTGLHRDYLGTTRHCIGIGQVLERLSTGQQSDQKY